MMEVYKIYLKSEYREKAEPVTINTTGGRFIRVFNFFSDCSCKNNALRNFISYLEKIFPTGNFATVKDFSKNEVILFTDVQKSIHNFEIIFAHRKDCKRPELCKLQIEHLKSMDDNPKTWFRMSDFYTSFYGAGPKHEIIFSNKDYWIDVARDLFS